MSQILKMKANTTNQSLKTKADPASQALKRAAYWQEHKAVINQKRCVKQTCDQCGKKYSKTHKARHLRCCKGILKDMSSSIQLLKDMPSSPLLEDCDDAYKIVDPDIGLHDFKLHTLKQLSKIDARAMRIEIFQKSKAPAKRV